MFEFKVLTVNVLYLLVLINPVSKVSVLSAAVTHGDAQDYQAVAAESSVVAAIILLMVMVFGEVLLTDIFRVQVYSLKIGGGAVLFWVGFNALRKGIFFEQDSQQRFRDMAIVPLACPMIAGPATIAASLTLVSNEGLLMSAAAVLIAVGINHVFMLFSGPVARALLHFNLLGALIRITGLVVMTVGVQMVLDGLTEWHEFTDAESLISSAVACRIPLPSSR